ncbi:hypothetical protein HOB94_06935 [bacterium]|nr:hypothetical protein [bacterium]MBT4633618.1 hypothetical protein [bacterium]
MITTLKVSSEIVDIVLQNTGTYQVTFFNHSSRSIAHFKTLACQASILSFFNMPST